MLFACEVTLMLFGVANFTLDLLVLWIFSKLFDSLLFEAVELINVLTLHYKNESIALVMAGSKQSICKFHRFPFLIIALHSFIYMSVQ
jgi:hypothetical protein